ncbi:MAG: DUF815 domain-containing protein, partial [Nitrosomonas sp.]
MNDLDKLCERADRLLDHLEKFLPPAQPEPDWQTAIAFRWRRQGNVGYIQSITHPHRIALDALCGIDDQKQRIDQNTQQFVQGFSANNVLLTG